MPSPEPLPVASDLSPLSHRPLDLVDAVGAVLARHDGHGGRGGTTADAEALRVVAEGFGALMSATVTFVDESARVGGLWSRGRFVSNPPIELGSEFLPTDAPLRNLREPVILGADDLLGEPAATLRAYGSGLAMVVAPVSAGDQVVGALAVLVADADSVSPDERMALQLCGELLWRHIRHHEARAELRERAELAEVVARVGARLHSGGVAEARQLLDEVATTMATWTDIEYFRTFDRIGDDAVRTAQWAADASGPPEDAESLALTADEWARLTADEVIVWTDDAPDPIAERFAAGHRSGVLVAGVVDGELVAICVMSRTESIGFDPTQLELVVSTVGLLAQFRARLGAELALVRRGVVDQCRTEIAESFINSPAEDIDDVVVLALHRVGDVFGARRVRWVEVAADRRSASLAAEWSDGSRPDAPMTFEVGFRENPADADARDPYLIEPVEVERLGLDSASPTLVVPSVVGDEVRGLLTLTGDALGSGLPDGERRALTDLAGLFFQARRRARQELDAERRRRLDDIQLRLARRFLDRTVTDADEMVDWALGEIGGALGTDVVGFAQFEEGERRNLRTWSKSSTGPDVLAILENSEAILSGQFAACVESGEPMVVRSRHLDPDLRAASEEITGGEFSLLTVSFRASGVGVLLGTAVFDDREWREMEVALLQQLIGQVRQFIEVVASRRKLEFDAGHDALTGLANRRRMADEFSALVATGRRGAMLMIDVDRFKVINDSLGHSAGDSVLVEIAERIQGATRADDLVGRFGGDEFAVMIADETSFELAATAQRLIEVIREPVMVRGTTVIPTCSIGIAVASALDDVEAVLRHADSALYDAKAKGRDRFEFFDDMHRHTLSQRLHLETALRRGVKAGEFVPWFQPEYDLDTGEIVGVEALVRWVRPHDGVVDASHFIDTAEEIGLAPEMSRLVIERSAETVRTWLDQGFETRVRVNVAAAQLQSRDLADQLARLMQAHDLAPEHLCVEITERSLMLDPDSAVDALCAIRSLGIEVAVDDFGTGFSSLARLKHLPVDTLKIDRSFVSGIVSNETDREIVRTIIWLSRGLGLGVVAEGVEHAEQAEMLRELGCRRAQGWLWSPAVPAAEVPRLVRV